MMSESPVAAKSVRQKNDAVAASIKNIREQKGLERQLTHIERLWHVELKHLTREKLEATHELTRLEEEKQNLEYLNDDVEGDSLKTYTDSIRDKTGQQRQEDKHIVKFSYQNSELNKVQLRLPDVHKPLDILKENGLHQSMPVAKKPKLYRSNSILRHHVENSVSFPPGITRTESKEDVKNINLPDIMCSDQSKTKFVRLIEKDVERFNSQSNTHPTVETPSTPYSKRVYRRKKKVTFPPLSAMCERRHTVL
ncbi:uncharacterized protein LOC110453435 [Mizuhopecten yessoensis]|uniref:Uncharacterized protein n=1 Tax=Mizuhopecten yessoensis TaxID=6573 RepID=A0A210QHA4_MIZYE|nr:uncharacterized protein LOC110453435 [Mizuhopecten yessoensis]OWF48155.1 hypothetical protein KP79_PYT01227 [Mizuhopecten yessoensis]